MIEPIPHPASATTIPVGGYALKMACTTMLAAGVLVLATMSLGANSSTIVLGLAAFGVASLATFVPALPAVHVTPANFGLFVLGGSMARMLLILAIGLGFDSTRELPRTAFWVGLLAAGGVVLLAESVFAITILSRIEKSKAQPRS